MACWLVGDVGGTKTTLALMDPAAGPRRPLRQETLPSRDFAGLSELVRAFWGADRSDVVRACFGVAGPVRAGRASLTNLGWELDAGQLARELGIASLLLLNDLEAVATAIPFLAPEDLEVLNAGEPHPKEPVAVIAPGTGLGEAYLTWDGTRYRAHPSEGGHTDFAPRDEEEIALLRYLLPRFGHISYERICSGLGLPNIYAFLRDTGRAEEPAWLRTQLEAAGDPNPIIVRAALEKNPPSPICKRTLGLFVSILGAEAGNMALKVLAGGGVYLAGGIPPRILPALREEAFRRAFFAKGRLESFLRTVPVYVVLNPSCSLIGAYYALAHPGS